jgi:hypothetical protein
VLKGDAVPKQACPLNAARGCIIPQGIKIIPPAAAWRAIPKQASSFLAAGRDIEFEEDDITIQHDVVLALQPK